MAACGVLGCLFAAAIVAAQEKDSAPFPYAARNFYGDSEAFSVGKIYVHTYRNKPIFKTDNEVLSVRAGSLLDNQNLSITCVKGQCVTLILSNRTAIFTEGPAQFAIEKFEQVQPFKTSMSEDNEQSRTVLRLSISYGEVFVSGLRPRPTSKTFVKTKFGVFEPQSCAYRLYADENSATLDLIDGQARFYTIGDKTDFLQQGQRGVASKSTAEHRYPLAANPINTVDLDTYKAKIYTAETASAWVCFSFDKDGKLTANRVIPKEFFLKKPKYDFRPY